MGLFFFVLTFSFFIYLIFFLQIDYCKEHKVFWRCKGFGCEVVETLPKALKQPEKQFWEAEPRPGNSSHHSRFFIFFNFFCRCNSATKQHLESSFQVRRNDAAKIIARFFSGVARAAPKNRARNRVGANLLRWQTQRKIILIAQLEKLRKNLYGF
jgi:hypothetical protein